MEAKILQIMESWPLQVTLKTADGIEHAMLAEKVSIWYFGVAVDPGVLRSNQRIRVLTRTPQGEIAELEILN